MSERSWRPAHLGLLDRQALRAIVVRWVSEDPAVSAALPGPQALWVPPDRQENVDQWVNEVMPVLKALADLKDLVDLGVNVAKLVNEVNKVHQAQPVQLDQPDLPGSLEPVEHRDPQAH